MTFQIYLMPLVYYYTYTCAVCNIFVSIFINDCTRMYDSSNFSYLEANKKEEKEKNEEGESVRRYIERS